MLLLMREVLLPEVLQVRLLEMLRKRFRASRDCAPDIHDPASEIVLRDERPFEVSFVREAHETESAGLPVTLDRDSVSQGPPALEMCSEMVRGRRGMDASDEELESRVLIIVLRARRRTTTAAAASPAVPSSVGGSREVSVPLPPAAGR